MSSKSVERFAASPSYHTDDGEFVRYLDHQHEIAAVKLQSDERHDLLTKERRANDNLRYQLVLADATIEGLAKRRDELLAQATDHQRIVKELEAELEQERKEKDIQVKNFNLEWARRRELEQAIERGPDPAVIGGAAIARSLVKSAPSLSDAIREVERMRDEWFNDPDLGDEVSGFYMDAGQRVIERLKSLSTQEGKVNG